MTSTRHHAHWPVGVPHTLEAPESTLFDRLEEAARRAPEKTAIDYYGRATSFRELHQSVLNLAGYMQQHLGVRRGDRVMLLMQNCPQFIVSFHAIQRCDAVVVSLSPMSTPDEIDYFAEDSGARVIITTQDMQARVEPAMAKGLVTGCIVGACIDMAGNSEGLPFLAVPDFVREARQMGGMPLRRQEHDFAGTLAAGIEPRPMENGPDDLAVIAYTSGTTGKPKGAMLKHRAFALGVAQRSLWFAGSPDCSDLIVLPMNHVAGMCAMNQAVCEGRTIVLLARWDAAAIPALIELRRIDRWAAVTPMLVELMGRPELAQHDISSLKRLYGGATAMPESVAREVEQRFGVPFIECYGMTETCGSSHMNPPQAPRLQCGGIPQINVDSRVIDPETGAELGPNEAGEIVMHCAMQFEGYWNRPDATREAFIEIDGKRFVRSGDIGHYDEDGYFYITDRLKRMINASGLKVWPAEVEACVYGHPAVQEACVIGVPDDKRGETVKALVVLKASAGEGTTPQALIEFVRSRLAAYKVPRVVEFVDSLPKTGAGKVLWRQLQEEHRKRAARDLQPA
ncbi:long-chain-fatty-acid--CoA ligase [Variovorax sp. YR216]|uniref:long-chain-fatty-acid--CoA ligase n=1 Tax=Variovorax sp. YR216 TaxID=1882828 RepID=UPI000895DB0B|nr:long-chain-fatty-acid--CoA ligase [Variovorax sp. YR216]SEB24719.1 fatty-acyl-CoA synthase [Variovorax sp. YR216]